MSFKIIKNNIDIINSDINIIKEKYNLLQLVNLIVVTKYQDIQNINYALDYGIKNFGENKVKDAINKWSNINYNDIKLHMIGHLQTNKVKDAVKFFDVIHTLDSIKLADKIKNQSIIENKNIECFIQINLANEENKYGVNIDDFPKLFYHCKDIGLNITGLMCINPANISDKLSRYLFSKLNDIATNNNLKNLSMGMSNDYKIAIECGANYIRLGSSVFNLSY